MSDESDRDKELKEQKDLDADREEVAQLLGKLLAWDYLERQKERDGMADDGDDDIDPHTPHIKK